MCNTSYMFTLGALPRSALYRDCGHVRPRHCRNIYYVLCVQRTANGIAKCGTASVLITVQPISSSIQNQCWVELLTQRRIPCFLTACASRAGSVTWAQSYMNSLRLRKNRTHSVQCCEIKFDSGQQPNQPVAAYQLEWANAPIQYNTVWWWNSNQMRAMQIEHYSEMCWIHCWCSGIVAL